MGLQPVRISKKKKVKRKRSPKKLIGDQARITTGQSIRQTEKLENCREQIKELRWMIGVLKEYVDPDVSVTLTALDLERYGDQRLGYAWWWLSFDLHLLDEYSDCPNIENYEFGSYWAGHKEGTELFIRARAEWALSYIEEELKGAEATLKELETRKW